MLSAEELFKFRNGLEQVMPSKGGEKEFMPDGSWLQDKHIESFHKERERVISEPRVSRSCDLVKGEWKPDLGLLELFHDMRNFWEHMGFDDNKRKWLYPEEALFLVEIGVLEMWYQDLPLSLQEAYAAVLGEKIQLEYYQVYAHLRRIGYVVLRHQGRYKFTKYERQVGLDKCSSSKKKRIRGKTGDQSDDVTIRCQSGDTALGGTEGLSNEHTYIDKSKNMASVETTDELKGRKSYQHSEEVKDGDQSEKHNSDDQSAAEIKIRNADSQKDGNVECRVKNTQYENSAYKVQWVQKQDNEKINRTSDVFETELVKAAKDTTKESIKETAEMDVEQVKTGSEWLSSDPKTLFHTAYEKSEMQSSHKLEHTVHKINQTKLSEWNFEEIIFPNFKSTKETVFVCKPNVDYIPQGNETCFNEAEYSFNKKQFINTKKQKKKQQLLDEEKVQELDFSHPEIMTGWHKVKKLCRNWKEYKVAVEKEKASWDRSKVFPHIYGNEVKPLVQPELARSTYAVLEQLKVIEEDVPSTVGSEPEILPNFDVYAPNQKFKKTKPGVPDFRVKVLRTCDPIPGLKTVNAISRYLNDEASLHWAVVNCGHIAFYSMSDMVLPQDISLG